MGLVSPENGPPAHPLCAANSKYQLQINKNSGINPEHLDYFKFIGRIVGLVRRPGGPGVSSQLATRR